MPPPSSAPFSTPPTAFTTMESSRDFKYVCFPLPHPSSLHLLDRLENIPHFSNDSNSGIVIVNFPFPPTLFAHLLTKKKILHSPNERLTSLASSFGYVFPGVVKKFRPRKTRVHLVHRYDHFHTHTQTKYKLIASSLRSHHSLRLPLQLSPFLCRQLHYLRPARRLQNGISESVSDQAKFFIWRLAALNQPNTLNALCYPWPTITTTTDCYIALWKIQLLEGSWDIK